MSPRLRLRLKRLLYPGMNLHTRLRYRALPRYLGDSLNGCDRCTLDAGCGNGMLAYRSFLKGNRVLGVSIKENEVRGCRDLFNGLLGIGEDRLRFENINLYDLQNDGERFDEIICAEVLEHIRDDSGICRAFWNVLKPEGLLHITGPNADHPYNASFPLDLEEKGGHVRPGYTLRSYRELLEPIGFEIRHSAGLGGPIRQGFSWRIKALQERLGPAAGLPLFLLALPFLPFDEDSPEVPFSLYVQAVKPIV